MSVYKQPDRKSYNYEFTIKGRRFRGNTGATSRAEAVKAEKAAKYKAKETVLRDKNLVAQHNGELPITVGVALARYFNEEGSRHKAQLTEINNLARLADYFGEETRLDAINDSMVADWVAARRGERVKGKKDAPIVSNATVNRTTIDVLRKVITRAKINWKVQFHQEPNWKAHRLKERGEMVRELSRADQERLSAELNEGYRDLWAFALISGLRLAECFIQWKQIDFNAGTITVVQKGDRPHTIVLSRGMKAIISRLEPFKSNQHDFVFTYVARRGGRGKTLGRRYPVTYSGMKTEWKRATKKLDVDLRFHDMRHTALTRMVRATGNLKIAQTMAGHSSITTTAKHYAHVMLDDVRNAMEALEEAENFITQNRVRTKNE